MARPRVIYSYEYSSLRIGETYNGVTFKESHFNELAKYLTANPKPSLFSLLHRRVRFCNFVGVLKVGDVMIEVLPKTDRHEEDQDVWQSVLLNMLAISLDVEAQCTTNADIQMKRHSVLETYIELFLNEARTIVHHGLVKKYRDQTSNQNSLKGRLQIQKHVSKNLVHAERFYVTHTIYDRNNIYNAILRETLECLCIVNISDSLTKQASSLLLDIPECVGPAVREETFDRLIFDRKTERYRTAIQLARTILLNFHPDVKGGTNNVLAIMFDMNHLWENYVYWILKKSARKSDFEVKVLAQKKRLFWQHPDKWSLRLVPDLLIELTKDKITKSFILDTKWKYQSDTTAEDVRQMYAYSHYFGVPQSFLLYPDKISEGIRLSEGLFHKATLAWNPELTCGVGFINLLEGRKLNKSIGPAILNTLFKSGKSNNSNG